MKLIRYGNAGEERPGVLYKGSYLDTSTLFSDYDERFFSTAGPEKLQQYLLEHAETLSGLPEGVRLGAPVSRPSKIVCIGLNYRDHAIETGAKIPVEPILFFKSTTALCGPNDSLVIPLNSQKTDWEIELAVVIGKKASNVPMDQAADHIAGYCMMNDYSERAFQKEMGGQFCKGKSCDSFAPLGPWMATPDEIPNPGNLAMQLKVNGVTYQNGNTSDLIFDIPFLISYISRFMTLLPGDIISTGTPAGVGAGTKPVPTFLRAGDVIDMKIEGLGTSRQVAVSHPGVIL